MPETKKANLLMALPPETVILSNFRIMMADYDTSQGATLVSLKLCDPRVIATT